MGFLDIARIPNNSTCWKQVGHPDSKVDVANIGPMWGLQDPGGPHAGPMNFAIWAFMIIRGIDWLITVRHAFIYCIYSRTNANEIHIDWIVLWTVKSK